MRSTDVRHALPRLEVVDRETRVGPRDPLHAARSASASPHRGVRADCAPWAAPGAALGSLLRGSPRCRWPGAQWKSLLRSQWKIVASRTPPSQAHRHRDGALSDEVRPRNSARPMRRRERVKGEARVRAIDPLVSSSRASPRTPTTPARAAPRAASSSRSRGGPATTPSTSRKGSAGRWVRSWGGS